MELNLTDKKILYELDSKARIPLTGLSKKLKLSRQVISYRLKNLEEQDIIRSYYPFISSKKLGLARHNIFLRLQDISKAEEIAEFLKEKAESLDILEGQWNLSMVLLVKDSQELQEIIKSLLHRFGAWIADKEIMAVTEKKESRKGFLLEKKNTDNTSHNGKPGLAKLDSTDRKILDILKQNAREPTISIAKKLGLGDRKIAYRISQLEKKGVILGYKINIDHKKIGYEKHRVLFYLNRVSQDDEKILELELKKHPNCSSVSRLIGKADLEAEIFTKTTDDLFSMMQELSSKINNLGYEKLRVFKELLEQKGIHVKTADSQKAGRKSSKGKKPAKTR